MNIIKIADRVDLYTDVTRNARYFRAVYDSSINDAIQIIIDSILNPEEGLRKAKGFQKDQFVSDNLYTLQKTQSGAPSGTIALYPNDYYFCTGIISTISSVPYYCRPTNQNEIGPLLVDSYRAPSPTKPYYLQVPTGFKIYSGTGTVTSVDLGYIKTPAIITIGKESQLINAGTGVLTNPTAYIATAPSIHNSISYNIGDAFTSANNDLTSGQVILATNTTDCDLPAKLHEEVAKRAAAILLRSTANYHGAEAADLEAQKS